MEVLRKNRREHAWPWAVIPLAFRRVPPIILLVGPPPINSYLCIPVVVAAVAIPGRPHPLRGGGSRIMPCRRPLGLGPLRFGVHPVVWFFRRYKIWWQIVIVVNGLLGYEFRFAKTWGSERRRSVARRCGGLGGCMIGSVCRTVWLGWTCREGRFLGLCCAIKSGRRNGADIENWCARSLCRRCSWGRQRTSRLWWFRIIIHFSQGCLWVSKLVVWRSICVWASRDRV
jgi:hypothetical protein